MDGLDRRVLIFCLLSFVHIGLSYESYYDYSNSDHLDDYNEYGNYEANESPGYYNEVTSRPTTRSPPPRPNPPPPPPPPRPDPPPPPPPRQDPPPPPPQTPSTTRRTTSTRWWDRPTERPWWEIETWPTTRYATTRTTDWTDCRREKPYRCQRRITWARGPPCRCDHDCTLTSKCCDTMKQGKMCSIPAM